MVKIKVINYNKTRKHSSRMHNTELPTVSCGIPGPMSGGMGSHLLDIPTPPLDIPLPGPGTRNTPRKDMGPEIPPGKELGPEIPTPL